MPLIDMIRESGFDCDNCIVSYWSPTEGVYVFVGKFPANVIGKSIPAADVNGQTTIQIKLRPQTGASPTNRQKRGMPKALGSLEMDAPAAYTPATNATQQAKSSA